MKIATTRSQTSSRHRLVPRSALRTPRCAFTLIELMVAVSILLVLTIMTVTVVNVTMDKDRVPSAARQIQSFLKGAKDRAIYSKTKTLNPGPRGVRFIRDPNNSETVTSMVYIGPPQLIRGTILIGEVDGSGNLLNRRKVEPYDSFLWQVLELRRLLVSGSRIEIPTGSKIFYTLRKTNNVFPGTWALTKDFPTSSQQVTQEYELTLQPAVLPNQEPRLLPRGTVIDVAPNQDLNNPPDFQIDIYHSDLPLGWYTAAGSNRMDIMFSPQGMVVGPAAAKGYIHLVVADLADAEQNYFTGSPLKEGEERVVTINTRTGSITIHSIDPTDVRNNLNGNIGSDGRPDDPFLFAETGEVSQ